MKAIVFLLFLLPFYHTYGQNQSFLLSEEEQTFFPEQIFLDTYNLRTIQDFKKGSLDTAFTTPTTSFPSITNVYWAKIELKNDTGFDNSWVVEFNPYWQYIDFFFIDSSGQTIHKISGQKIPFLKKDYPIRDRNFILLKIKNRTYLKCYIKYQIEHSGQLKPSFQSKIRIQSQVDAEEIRLRGILNVFTGIFVIMFAYNLMIYIGTKDINYLLYLPILIFMGMNININFGYHFEVFKSFENYHEWFGDWLMPWAALTNISLIVFAMSFLKVKTLMPKWNTVLKIIIALNILAILPTYFDQENFSFLSLFMIRFIAMIAIFIVAILGLRRKVPSAGMFLLAQTALLLSMLVLPMVLAGILPLTKWALFSTPIGSTIEIVLFSFALSNRINLLRKASGKFVPYEFLHSLGKESITDIKLGDHVERVVTVLFSDIRAYTSISENMNPEENFQFVSEYAARMGPIVYTHNGFINQYMGDGIMSLFPMSVEDAINASIEMQKNIMQFNALLKSRSMKPIKIGIGIHTGPLIMGIIGDELRSDATIISDAVNSASRMEGLTKYFGVSIIVSEETLVKIENLDMYNYRFIGKVQVKGKKVVLKVYDFFDGDEATIIAKKAKTKKSFEKGLAHYLNLELQLAIDLFKEVLEQNPDDETTKRIFNKCEKLLHSDLPEGWTGVETIIGE